MRVSQLVEAVDLYRTLADLSGVGEDLVEPGVDGVSLGPLLRGVDAPLRPVAKSQFPRCWSAIPFPPDYSTQTQKAFLDAVCCASLPREKFDLMGYSIRTREWRFTEWRLWDGVALRARWDLPANATELYDHRTPGADIFSTETVNLAADPKYKSIVKMLQPQLREAFPSSAPSPGPSPAPSPSPSPSPPPSGNCPTPKGAPTGFVFHRQRGCYGNQSSTASIGKKWAVSVSDCAAACLKDDTCASFHVFFDSKRSCLLGNCYVHSQPLGDFVTGDYDMFSYDREESGLLL